MSNVPDLVLQHLCAIRADMHAMLVEQRAQTELIATIARRIESYRDVITAKGRQLETHLN